ncbi:unnamed protein product, partial [Mesorhabditis spiculigera]
IFREYSTFADTPDHQNTANPLAHFRKFYQNQSLINILLSSLPIDTARKLERRFYGKAEMRSNQQLRWHFAYVLWNLHSSGLGGGMLGTVFEKSTGFAYSIDALEISAQTATENLFNAESNRDTGTFFLRTFAFLNQKPNASVVDFTLAETMRRLATTRDPVQLFYRGDIANQIIREMKQNGGILQKSDFVNYVSHVSRISSDSINNMHIFGPHRPAATSYILLVLSVLQESLKNSTDLSPDKFFHRLLEAEKFSLGRLQEVDSTKRFQFFGSRRSRRFGAMKRSEQLGIVWNNGLDGFSDPESANSLEPRKRAKSLMCPLIRSDDKASPSSPFLLKV